MRQVNLGLDFFFAAQRSRGLPSVRMSIRGAADVRSHFLRFMVLDRTGVRLLFGHSNKRERVENGLALNFQFSGEIVDSNLTHPAFLFPRAVLGLHRSLTESTLCTRTHSNLSARAMVIRLFREQNLPAHALALHLAAFRARMQ